MRTIVLLINFVFMLLSCRAGNSNEQVVKDEADAKEPVTVIRKDTLGLIVLYPQYSKVDLVCGTVPSKSDSRVILFAEAAYTGELLKEFKHFNIAGDHVSAGKRYKGYRCKRNTGAFVYYGGSFKFCHKDYSQEMDRAAANGGASVRKGVMTFGIFKKQLLNLGITDALYLDMGAGWNHAWYRDRGKIVELHPKLHDYCTNWITFYK